MTKHQIRVSEIFPKVHTCKAWSLYQLAFLLGNKLLNIYNLKEERIHLGHRLKGSVKGQLNPRQKLYRKAYQTRLLTEQCLRSRARGESQRVAGNTTYVNPLSSTVYYSPEQMQSNPVDTKLNSHTPPQLDNQTVCLNVTYLPINTRS